MINKVTLVVALCSLLISPASFAKRYWPAPLTDWTLSLNNGVAYVTSPQMAEHCSYSRAQINMTGTEFDKALYAYALTAKARAKKLRYVVDDTHTTCVISGLAEVEE